MGQVCSLIVLIPDICHLSYLITDAFFILVLSLRLRPDPPLCNERGTHSYKKCFFITSHVDCHISHSFLSGLVDHSYCSLIIDGALKWLYNMLLPISSKFIQAILSSIDHTFIT